MAYHTANSSTPQRYLPALDGLRALSILLVLAAHTANPFESAPWRDLFDQVSRHGNTGVAVFFAISGVLIAGRLLDEERSAGYIHLGRFYLRRAFRILPPVFAYLGLLVMVSGALRIDPLEIVSSFLFFRNYVFEFQSAEHWYTSHFWSLAVEEHFYLLVPVALVIFRQHRLKFLTIALVGIWGWRAWLRQLGWSEERLWPHSDTSLDALVFAAMLAVLMHEARWQIILNRLLTPWVTFALAAAGIWIRLSSPALAHEILVVLIGLAVVGAVKNAACVGYRLLEHPLVRWIGRLSYSTYLWQQLFFCDRFLGPNPPLGRFGHWPLNFICVFICSCASYYLIERPSIKLGHRLARSKVLATGQPVDLQGLGRTIEPAET